MTARRGYPAVDRFRVAAALLVVCIHTAPLAFFSAAADFALKTLARLAVPFFFTATGFFLLGELVRPGLRPRTLSPGVRRFLKKTGVLYAACTVLYLPVTLYAGNFPVENVLGELVRDAVLDGTFYHLWYLPAALLGVLVVCGLLRFLRPGAAAGVCGALYLAGLLGDSWYGLAKQLPALKEGYDALFGVMDYTRNGLFFAPAFLMLGALLAGFPARRRPRACLAGLGCSLALLFAEAFGLRALGWPRHDSMYLALVPCACFLFLCLLVPRGVPAVPTKLYNLEILQYDRNGTYQTGKSYGDVNLGTHLDVTLNVMNDCQLLVVARGNKDAVKTLVGKNLEDTESTKGVKSMDIDASIINQIDPSTADAIDAMPYVLHLEHVNVVTGTDGKAVIQSPEGSYDTRLLLKRLAARLTVSWNYTVSGYELKQVLLQSVPLNYTLVPTADSNGTYPSILDQFHTVEIDMSKGNSYSCWIPANVRGESPAANSDLQRTKANAPKGSSFLNFVAVNTTDPKKKLDYRVYIGGKTSSDFSLNNNTEYSYAVSFSHTGIPTNDKRVTYIDPVPASENNDNPVPTANCFMVAPGGGFCFDPLAYQSDGTEKTNETLKGWCQQQGGGIVKVKLLWQTKEDGDIGEPVMGIVNSAEDHTNIVDIKRTDGTAVGQNPVTDKGQCRIYCRVAPGTTGGSGVIAAYDSSDNILWSWHVWVTDYHPDATGNVDVQEPLTKRKLKFTYGNHPDQRPMMDRNLGAMAGYTGVPPSDVEKFKTHGFHYQWGRKDPYPSSYSNRPPLKKVLLPNPE